MILHIKEIFRPAIRLIWKNYRFIWLYWGANLAFSIVLSLPVFYLLNDNLQHSAISDSLSYGFDYIWYLQFRNLYGTNIGEIPYMIYGVAGIYVLIQTFFLGGLISIYNNTKKDHYVDFFYGGVKYWYRFTKVLLLSVVFYSLAFELNDITGKLLSYMFADQEKIIFEFILRASRYLFLIFLLGMVTAVGDYLKVALGTKDSSRIFPEIYPLMGFLKDNFSRVFTVFFLVAIMGALGAIVYNFLNDLLPKSHYLYLLLTFILQQFLIIFRLSIKMLFTATEVILYKDINAQVIPAQVEEVI
ncbi:MAG: hypothetical protein HF314_05260 [Ignavibacteria bacterium]|jgi:hypothetical protein|nr:hypothetical protein [Ignavibacteria bacterium]MCU7502459.1 hypothetical protein [Ignavibacteria bacterium]MCU7514976.1 hypothetical protein [Ignavibacteria bacterium]